MEDFHFKYAQNLTSNDINDLYQTLVLMRSNLKEELDFLMYLKNVLFDDQIKYFDIINKLESLILKDIEKTGEFIILIQRNIVVEIDDKNYNRYEDIKESYNESLLNLQKFIESSSELLNNRVKFIKERKDLSGLIDKRVDNNSSILNDDGIKKNNDNEMLDKLKLDIDSLSRRKYEIIPDSNTYHNNDSYSVDKEIDILSKMKVRRKSPSITEPSKEKNKLKSQKTGKNVKNHKVLTKTESSNKSERIKVLNTENLNNLHLEAEKIKIVCKEIEKSLNENCIMENERKNVDKLKNEIIRISSDIQNFKDDVKDFKKDLLYLVKKLDYLEIENKNLKQRNYNLFSFANNITSNKPSSHFTTNKTNNTVNYKNPNPRVLIPNTR